MPAPSPTAHQGKQRLNQYTCNRFPGELRTASEWAELLKMRTHAVYKSARSGWSARGMIFDAAPSRRSR